MLKPSPHTPAGRRVRTLATLALLCAVTLPNAGCRILIQGLGTAFAAGNFFWTTPLIPVTPYMSQKVEDAYWEEERYDYVPVLDPVEGENAPLFCLDPPSEDQIMRALPDNREGGVPFLAETRWNNVQIVTELIVDRIDEPRFYPMAGPARLKHCHYKCTVFYDETKTSAWPVPFTHTDRVEQVVYIDKDFLVRVAGPAAGEL